MLEARHLSTRQCGDFKGGGLDIEQTITVALSSCLTKTHVVNYKNNFMSLKLLELGIMASHCRCFKSI